MGIEKEQSDRQASALGIEEGIGDGVRLGRKPNLALALIVGLYLCFGAVHLAVTPVFEKPDEEWHAAYVFHLLYQRRLPPLVLDPDQNPAFQIAGHPPLFYATSAALLQVTGLTRTPPTLQANPFWGYPALGTTPDNKNRYLHSPAELSNSDWRSIYLLRGFSMLLGTGAIFAAYGIALALTRQTKLGLMSAALVAVLPQYSFIASSVSNDALVASLSGLALLALIHASARRESWRYWVLFGLLAGLAALTKTSALLLPIFGAGVAVAVGIKHRSWKALIAGSLISLGLWLAIGGWWYVRNAVQFGDPLGVGVHVAAYGRSIALSGWQFLNQWQRTSVTFWAAFGWSNVQFPGWVYAVYRAIEMLALTGLLVHALRGRIANKQGWIVAASFTALTIGAYLWWTMAVTGTLGRLLFPALAPLAFFFSQGLNHWSSRLWAVAWAFVASTALLAPAFIAATYQPPARIYQAATPGQQPIDAVTFGELARLVHVEVSPQKVAPGESIAVTLCWEPLVQTNRNYALFVQVLGEADRKVGERNTHPGLGNYPTSQWQPGHRFCDQIDVPILSTAPAPAAYSVVIGLQDLETGQNLSMVDAHGQLVSLLTISQIKVTGPNLPASSAAVPFDANFGDLVTLAGYEVGTLDTAQRLPLVLYWQAQAPIAADYTVFVHLLGADGQPIAQADSPPQQGRYPTHLWDVGEMVSDLHLLQLPEGLPAGHYPIRIGLYLPQTGERLRLSEKDEDSVMLPSIPIQP